VRETKLVVAVVVVAVVVAVTDEAVVTVVMLGSQDYLQQRNSHEKGSEEKSYVHVGKVRCRPKEACCCLSISGVERV